jgi:hypothetical protein
VSCRLLGGIERTKPCRFARTIPPSAQLCAAGPRVGTGWRLTKRKPQSRFWRGCSRSPTLAANAFFASAEQGRPAMIVAASGVARFNDGQRQRRLLFRTLISRKSLLNKDRSQGHLLMTQSQRTHAGCPLVERYGPSREAIMFKNTTLFGYEVNTLTWSAAALAVVVVVGYLLLD